MRHQAQGIAGPPYSNASRMDQIAARAVLARIGLTNSGQLERFTATNSAAGSMGDELGEEASGRVPSRALPAPTRHADHNPHR